MKKLITPHTELPVSVEHTIGAWRCDEAAVSDFIDSSSNGYDLTDASLAGVSSPLFGVNKGATGSRSFDGTADAGSRTAATSVRSQFLDPITICVLFKPTSIGGNRTMFYFGGLRTNEAQAENITMLVGLSGSEIKAGWEYNGGINNFLTTSGMGVTAGKTYCLVVTRYETKKGTSGNMDMRVDLWDVATKSHKQEFYLDKVAPNGGTNSNFVLGAEQGFANFFAGDLDEVHAVSFGDPEGYFARWYFGLVVGFNYSEENLYLLKNYQSLLKIKIENSDGDMIDLSSLANYESVDFIEGVSITRSIDDYSRTASISLRREFDKFSLSPDIETSLFNIDGAGSFGSQIDLRRRVLIEVATIPSGQSPNDWDFILHFDGVTNSVSYDSDVIDLTANDLSQELESTFILTERSYAGTPILLIDDSGASNAVEIDFSENHHLVVGDLFEIKDTENYNGNYTVATVNSSSKITTVEVKSGSLASEAVGYIQTPTLASTVMQSIIDDNNPANASTPDKYKGGVPSIWMPTAITWTLRFFIQTYSTVFDALNELASQFGGLLSYEFDDFKQAYRLKLREPNRAATHGASDPVFSESDIIDVQDLSKEIADIRNSGTVNYFDLDATPDADGGYQSKSKSAFDASSVAKYGLREFKISNAWNIDSATEAQALVDDAISDMAEPKAFLSASVLFRRFVEVNDFYRFNLPNRHFTTAKDLAVTSFTDSFAAGVVTTSLNLRGQPSGNPVAWRNRIDEAFDRYKRKPLAASNVRIQEAAEGLMISWDAPVNNGKKSTDWFEVHVKAGSASFTPDSSTLIEVVRGSAAVVLGLDAGTNYAVHVVARDVARNASIKSTVQVGNPNFTAIDKPTFKAYRSTDQTLSTSPTKFTSNVEQFDIGNNFDSATNYRFTAPVRGVYGFSAKIKVDFAKFNESLQLSIRDAGGATTLIEGAKVYGDGLSTFVEAELNGFYKMAAGDTAELFLNFSAAATLKSNGLDSNWSAFLYSETT